MDTTLSPPAGQLIDGRYRVEAQLARGGMATVYLGTDTRLDRAVALKIAHPELAADEEFVRRFIGEARAAARLSSPHVVGVYDQGSDGRLHYLVMEYVSGWTLRELLSMRGKLAPDEALDIFEGVLRGLAVAHESGIVHRDVKPENVLLTGGNVAKVADFGLARAAAVASHTKTGVLIGTAAYLAPEQVSSGSTSTRTDVYAAGVMLFELLTGSQPHTGESPLAVAYKHVNETVPAPSAIAPGVPAALDALVRQATSQDPEQRPADARRFLHAVSDVRRRLRAPAGSVPGHAAPDPSGSWPAGPALRSSSWPAQPGADSWPAHPGTGSWPAQPGAGSWPGEAGPGSGPGSRPGESRTAPVTGALAADARRAQSRHARPEGAAAAAAWHRSPAPGEVPATPAGLPGTGADSGLAAFGFRGTAADVLPAGTAPGHARPPGRPHAAANHTLIVPAGQLAAGFGDDNHHVARPRRGYRRPDEPVLQRLLFSRRLVYLAAAIAVALAGGLGIWWVTSGQYGTIPQVAGMPLHAARADLRSLGFTARTGPGRHTPLPAGTVIGTRPAAGARARRGSPVAIVTSLGPLLVQVPPVTGLPLADAEAALRRSGLTPAVAAATPSTTIPAGIVISTSPVTGTSWPKARPVTITISAGPPLPVLVGQQVQAAEQAAQAGGYSINPIQDPRGSAPQGTIVRQSPAAGTAISPHEVVNVYVSPGPPMAAIPDVQGMREGQAVQLLQRAGFKVSINAGIGLGGWVTGYSPTGQAAAGSTITLDIGFMLP